MALRFTRLTRPNIRALKPGEKITEYGMIAECLPDGDIRYTVNIMADGQRVHRVVGRMSDGVTRKRRKSSLKRPARRREKGACPCRRAARPT